MGFVLQAVLDCSSLPEWATASLHEVGYDATLHRRLVLLGQAGTSLWERMDEVGYDSDDRCDDYSRSSVDEWFAAEHPDATNTTVYPGDALVPLGRLAELAGWGRPSPLGLTIHPAYGPWIAHRIALLTDLELPVASGPHGDHPCDSCIETPCVSACPVGAVSTAGPFDIDACATHRAGHDSACAYECLARNACPVGSDHRYGPVQMRHHYGSGLESIRRYATGVAEQGSGPP